MTNELFWIICIVTTAGFIQGLSGFGSAIIAIPLLSFFLDIKTSVALITLIGIVINVINAREHWPHSQSRRLRPLIISAMFGVPLGVVFINSVREAVVLGVLAFLLIAFSLYSLRGPRIQLFARPSFAYLSGFFSGWLGATLSISGPPVIFYTAAQNWPAMEKKSLLARYFLLISLLTSLGFYLSGMITQRVMILFAYAIVPLIAGTYLGILAFNRIASARHDFVLNLFVLGLGLVMLAKVVMNN